MPPPKITCFFITPFGDKSHQMAGGAYSDFDRVYLQLKDALESIRTMKLQVRKADEIRDKIRLSHTVIQAIHDADVVVADLSAHNPNVFYELGIRHTLGRLTIHIRQRGTQAAIDVVDVRAVEYDLADLPRFRSEMEKELKDQLAHRSGGVIHPLALPHVSPVYGVLPELRVVTAQDIEAYESRLADLQERLSRVHHDSLTDGLRANAIAALQERRTARALHLFRQVHQAAPHRLDWALEYGRVLSGQELHEEACDLLEEVVRSARSTGAPVAPALKEFGLALKRAGRYRRAREVLTAALQEDRKDDDLLAILGGLAKDMGELDEALRLYEEGLEVNPASTYCLLNMICLRLVRGGNGDRAYVDGFLKRVDELTAQRLNDPSADHWAWFDRAHALLFIGRVGEAQDALERAIARTASPGDLRSAESTLDLLRRHGRDIPGMTDALARMERAVADLSVSAPASTVAG